MRITEAAQRLGTSPRMLRYRDLLGLLPPVRPGRPAPRARRHRKFTGADLEAVALALRIEQRYDISPAALAFGLRVLTEPGVRADVTDLGRRISRIGPPPARALEFEKERALRLLRLTPDGLPRGRPAPARRNGSRDGGRTTGTPERRDGQRDGAGEVAPGRSAGAPPARHPPGR